MQVIQEEMIRVPQPRGQKERLKQDYDEPHLQQSPAQRGDRLTVFGRVLLLFSLITAAISHGYHLFLYPLYITDEGIYMQQAWSVLRQGRLSPYTYSYDHAPAGWLVIAGWVSILPHQFEAFGNAINPGRVLMLLVHVASVFLLFQSTRRLSGSLIAAVMASFLFNLSPLAVYYQRQVLLDNLMVFTVNLAPSWVSPLLRGAPEPAASRSPARPAPPVRRRLTTAPGAARVATNTRTTSLQLQGTDLTPKVPLRFVGSGFLPGEALVVTIQDHAGQPEAQLAPLSADQAGQISTATEAIPINLSPGTHMLLVQGESSHRSAQASFHLHWIPPTVQLDTYTVKPEQDVGFAGSGFLPNETVEVRLGTTGQGLAQVLATVSANAGGNVAGRFTVPLMPEGDYALFFVGQQSQAPTSVGLNVQGFHPWVVLDTYAPSPMLAWGLRGRASLPTKLCWCI